jgi:hypothetical protein
MLRTIAGQTSPEVAMSAVPLTWTALPSYIAATTGLVCAEALMQWPGERDKDGSQHGPCGCGTECSSLTPHLAFFRP